MAKKYRLLKDLPYTLKGVIYTPENDDPNYYCYNGGKYRNRISKDYVENNPTWFEEIKEKEKLWVDILYKGKTLGDEHVYRIFSFTPISESQQKEIKSAIESILNNEQPIEEQKTNRQLSGEFITLEEVVRRQKDAFDGSRLTHPVIGFKFETYEEYQKWFNEKLKYQ